MKLPTSNVKSSSWIKPHIKKGYYPSKLLSIKPFADKDGVLKEGKYGHQVILNFAVYAGDANGLPTDPMTVTVEGSEEPRPVEISKFVYYEYKNDKAKDGEPIFRTAVTPKSDITNVFECLGWTFTEEDLDMDLFIGSWAELNIDDYEQKGVDGFYTASTIQKINKYEGPAIEDSELSQEEELRTQIANLDGLKASGDLTEEGYDKSKEQLEAQLAELTA